MLKDRTRCLIAVLLIPACVGCGTKQENPQGEPEQKGPPVELRAEVDRAEATTGDAITFRVILEADPSIDVSLPEIGSQIQGFRIIDMGEEEPRLVEGKKRIEKTFRLQADVEGSYILPATRVSYKDEDGKEQTSQTGQIFVKVKGTQAKGQDQDIRDIKPLRKIKTEIPKGLLAALAALLLVVVGVGLMMVYRRRRNKAIQKALSPEERAEKELADLLASGLLEEGLLRDFVFGLSMIFRRYLERKYTIRAAEHTTEEILADLRQCASIEEEPKKATKDFLIDIDPIKYRGMEPSPQEVQGWVSQLETFIQIPLPVGDGHVVEEAA